MIEMLNKIDLLRAGSADRTARPAMAGGKRAIAVSALTGEGLDALLARFEDDVTHDNISLEPEPGRQRWRRAGLGLSPCPGAGAAGTGRQDQPCHSRIHPDRSAAGFENRFPKKIKL